MTQLRLLLAQINPIVGHLTHNTQLILEILSTHQTTHDVILFPELALTGYPPEDLLYRDDFFEEIAHHLKRIQEAAPNCHVILGHPEKTKKGCFNAASVFYQKRKLAFYHKQQLPNHGVFDEQRYFTPGEAKPCILTLNDMRIGLCICEDLWHPEPIQQLLHADIQGIFSLNASPFDHQKQAQRLSVLTPITQKGLFVAYVNLVGGQDELIFDGQSMVLDVSGQIQALAPAFESTNLSVEVTPSQITGTIAPTCSDEAMCYTALVTATRDYVHKNQCEKAIIGLSGGIDSALTLAIAVDALGAANVTAVKMPSRYTEDISVIDADAMIQALQIPHHTLAIEPIFETFLQTLNPLINTGVPTENLQARIRGTLLMALSNQTGALVLTTSNKSEMAVGYATLYGDMAGGFAVLKDVYKTEVYRLARYRNTLSPIIPERIFTRPPTAELAPNQTDQDTLPPYERLDPLIQAYMENNATMAALLAQGFSEKEIHWLQKRMQQTEYKRKQAPIGPKITPRAFGRDWRLPVTQAST